MKPEEPESLVGAASSVAAATLISRLLGLVREQVVAYLFGAVRETDAFGVAFRIPNLLRDLFAEGALSSAFVPTFTEVRSRRGERASWLVANRVLTALVGVLSLITIAIFLFARPIAWALAPGFAAIPGKLDLAAQMARIMSPFLLFVALASVMMGILNTYGRFFVPSVAPAAFNISCIVCAILLTPLMPGLGLSPIVSLAIGALLGAAGQFVFQVPSAVRCGFRYRPSLALGDPDLARMLRLMIPAIVGLSATQVAILVDTQFASRYGDGAVSCLGYAFRLIQLPIGLFGVAIATANLASASRHAAAGDLDSLKDSLARALRLAAFLTLPATAGLIALGAPIVRLLYEHGRFTSEATRNTAGVLLCYSLGLFAYSAVKILVPTFYALGDARLPVVSSLVSVAAKIGLNFPLTGLLLYKGLALSTSIAALVNLSLLSLALRRRLGGLRGRGILTGCARIAVVSVLVGATARGVGLLGRALGPGRGAEAVALAAAVGAGLTVLFLGSRALGVREMDELLGRFAPAGFSRRREDR